MDECNWFQENKVDDKGEISWRIQCVFIILYMTRGIIKKKERERAMEKKLSRHPFLPRQLWRRSWPPQTGAEEPETKTSTTIHL